MISEKEQKILREAEKIKKNQTEDERYREQLKRYLAGSMPAYERFELGENSNILKLFNSTAEKIVLNQSDIKNALADYNSKVKKHTGGHQILPDELYKLSKEIREPVMVLKGSQDNPNSVVMITELKNAAGKNVVVPIALDRQNGKVSRITTLYGKDNILNYLNSNVDNILATNIEKAEKLYRDIGFQSPKLNTVLCFNNSIAYTIDNVTYDCKKFLDTLSSRLLNNIEKISEDLKRNGFQPTKTLVGNMDKLNKLSGKEMSIKDVHSMHSSMKNPEIQNLVNEIAKECRGQELAKQKIPGQ